MADTRHPDLEIYLKDCPTEAIINWLTQLAEHCEITAKKPDQVSLKLGFPSGSTAVMIQQRVVGKAWTSLWLQNNVSPWDTDIACAEQAHKELEVQVRCIASGWQEGDEPDEWWKVSDGQKSLITWHTQ